ncbi:hypothetical protein [Actinoplanes subtropicus]|uniref:hypothetical protein n=1 Tax=Actinoplanes subtropicus TaxID=543632 RepID=UPI0004C2D144|nr:hypothetical protein [Actinoplanes subtropicus]
MQAGVVLISLAALAVSLYGILERRGAARRAERLRFATLVDDLNNLRLAYRHPTTALEFGDEAAFVNARAELLAVQAFLLRNRLHDITSPEYRTLAFALSRSGYPAEADQSWREALLAAGEEGPTQQLFAHRGYAFFLFAAGRPGEARDQMRLGLQAIGSADDNARIHQIKTYVYWAIEERTAGGEEAELRERAEQEIGLLDNEHARRRMRAFLESPD